MTRHVAVYRVRGDKFCFGLVCSHSSGFSRPDSFRDVYGSTDSFGAHIAVAQLAISEGFFIFGKFLFPLISSFCTGPKL